MASRLPGSGIHSSGDLIKASDSSLTTPSRSKMINFILTIDYQRLYLASAYERLFHVKQHFSNIPQRIPKQCFT